MRAAAGHGVDEGRVLEDGLVVDEDGDRLAAARDRRHRPPRAGLRELDRATCVVDVATILREPVAEDERAIAERAPELVP